MSMMAVRCFMNKCKWKGKVSKVHMGSCSTSLTSQCYMEMYITYN